MRAPAVVVFAAALAVSAPAFALSTGIEHIAARAVMYYEIASQESFGHAADLSAQSEIELIQSLAGRLIMQNIPIVSQQFSNTQLEQIVYQSEVPLEHQSSSQSEIAPSEPLAGRATAISDIANQETCVPQERIAYQEPSLDP